MKNSNLHGLHVRLSFFAHFAVVLGLSTMWNDLCSSYEDDVSTWQIFSYLQIDDSNFIPEKLEIVVESYIFRRCFRCRRPRPCLSSLFSYTDLLNDETQYDDLGINWLFPDLMFAVTKNSKKLLENCL